MSFKRYLITTFSSVLLVLFGLFWWLVDNLTEEIDRELANSMMAASQQAINVVGMTQVASFPLFDGGAVPINPFNGRPAESWFEIEIVAPTVRY